ncbi:MAG: hydroxymyristoyl-ACP dehydratase [Alistipes sp.]|nr:hydroxymyristoyl-ACP dehydratase [Alistipes sp.]
MFSIEELIPQRAPIVMVDRLTSIEEGVSYTELEVRADNLFVERGVLSECGLIEHIAQSAAARIGYLFRMRGEAVPIGYIGSVNQFALGRLPRVGERLTTAIRVLQEVYQVSLVEAEVRSGDEVVASSRMKIFLEQ